MTDTSSFQQADVPLPDSETRLQRILDTVVAFVGRLTLEGVLTEANEPALAAANLERDDVIGKPFWDCYWWNHDPEVQSQLRDAIRRAATGETLRYDVNIRVADDALITIDFQLAPNFDDDGNVIELIPSGVDITERKAVEEQLRRGHDTFFNLIQHAPFGVYFVDSQFRLVQISAGAQKVFSNIDPLIGRDFEEVLRVLWPEPFVSEAVARFRHTLATGEPFRSADTTEQRADVSAVESYDWQIDRIMLPDGQFGVVCYFYDLTEQRRAEMALADSQAAYRLALQAARSGAWEWDVVNDRIGWSPEVGEMLGIAKERFPGDVGEFLELVHEEDRANVESVLRRRLEGGLDDYEIECRMRGDGNGFRWTRGIGKIERDADGKAVRIIGLVSDIDELRRTQQIAQERGVQIQNLLNSTAEGIYGLDLNGACTFANPACTKLLGYASPADLIGRNMHELIHHHRGNGSPCLVDDCRIYQAFRTGEHVHVEDEVFWRGDGSSFPVEYWSYPVFEEGRIVGSVVTFFDITDRRATERDLQDAAERLGLALDVGEMGVWDWDLQTGSVEWSDYHYTLAGYEIGEVVPSYAAWRARVHPDDLPRIEDAIDRARTGKTLYESSFRIQHPDGEIVHVTARGRFFYDGADQPIRMLGVLDNITRLKAAEENQELLLGELNHRVKNTLATIQAMASHTLRSAPDPESFRDRFVGRLRAIASAHDLLMGSSKAGAQLVDLITRQVGLYADVDGGQVRLSGPDVTLDAAAAHALSLVLHELVTNASKYGALSNPEGQIDTSWAVTTVDGCPMVDLRWQERGGPTVQAPTRTGFGSRLIEQTLKHSLAGDVALSYDVAGFNADLRFPMEAGYDPIDKGPRRRG